MSIASEITRLQGAKSSIKSAIEAKGVTVPSNALIDSFATYIAQISGGGSTSTTYNTYSPKYNSDNTASNNTYYSRFFATPSSFKCYAASTKYFRTNRTYKWIAIWK